MADVDMEHETLIPAPTRWFDVPFVAHVAALVAVLALGMCLSGPRVAFTSDEGGAILQARMLINEHTWIYRYPLASLDPENGARPFIWGEQGDKGPAPYAKHPLYPVVIAGSLKVAGEAGLGLLGIIGTASAAVASAMLARRLGRGHEVATLWIIGIGSPLFFYSYVVVAHTLAAAAVAGATLAAFRALDADRSRYRRVFWVIASALLAMVSTMLRTEALFLAPGLALALAVLAWRRTASVRGAFITSSAVVGGVAAGWLVDRAMSVAILGRAIPGSPPPQPSSWFAGRWHSMEVTWFQPSYYGHHRESLVLALAALLLAAGGIALRLRTPRRGFALTALVAAVGCFAFRLAVGSPDVITGLMLAFPLGWAGLWVVRRPAFKAPMSLALMVASVTIAGGVALTQYPWGGGAEWGGRYFLIVVPLVTPVLVVAGSRALTGATQDRLTRLAPIAIAGLVVFPALLALQSLHSTRMTTAGVLDEIRVAASDAGVAEGFNRQIVVSTNRLLPQIAYRDFDRYDWVVPADLERYGTRLHESGVDRVVLVSGDLSTNLAQLPGWKVVDDQRSTLPVEVVVLQHD